jgi:hypothetical protein
MTKPPMVYVMMKIIVTSNQGHWWKNSNPVYFVPIQTPANNTG